MVQCIVVNREVLGCMTLHASQCACEGMVQRAEMCVVASELPVVAFAGECEGDEAG